MQCTQLLGGSDMKCVKSHPSCVAAGQACGGPGRQTLTCCDGMQCRALLGGNDMKCAATQGAAAILIPVNSTNQTATLEATHDAAAVLIPGNSTDQTATLEAICPGCRQCSVEGENCGKQHWWSPNVACCGGYRCDNVLGGTGKKCVREQPACVSEGSICGGAGRRTLDCCDSMQCTQLLGGSDMKCVKSHPSCVAAGQACGGPGRQTLTCCDGMQCR